MPATLKNIFNLISSTENEEDWVAVIAWPPNAFGVCAYILETMGLYDKVLADDWRHKPRLKKWRKKVAKLGDEWVALQNESSFPSKIKEWWKTIWSFREDSINDLHLPKHKEVVWALLSICVVADEALSILNMRNASSEILKLVKTVKKNRGCKFEDARGFVFDFRDMCYENLNSSEDADGSTLCRGLDTTILRVLPKKKCPSVGISLRSISQNVGLWVNSEVTPRWVENVSAGFSAGAFNVLLVPWPESVEPSQFKEVSNPNAQLPDGFGMFDFEINTDIDALIKRIKNLLKSCSRQIGKVHLVVLPELSLNPTCFKRLSQYLAKKQIILIAGLGDVDKSGVMEGANQVKTSIPYTQYDESFEDLPPQFIQCKHHRWQVGSEQLAQYGLGSILDPQKTWWENTRIEARQLGFVELSPSFVLSTIVCEDLARQDPVSSLLRTVGPNLIIALLMDGPQVKGRWPDRYATVLADDPGSSVLTLTSIGMANLSKPLGRKGKPSRSIGIWKDSSSASLEIELEKDASGVILCVSSKDENFYSADGRKSRNPSRTPILSGVHQVRVSDY